MNKDQWTDFSPSSDPSKGDRPIGQAPLTNLEESRALGKKSGPALKDEAKEMAKTASETAKDIGKEAKTGASDIAKSTADIGAAAKAGAKDAARAGSESAQDAGKELRKGAQEIGKTAGDVASTVKESAQDAASELKQGAKGVLQHTKDAAADVGDAVKDVVAAAKDRAIDVGTATKDAMAVAKDDASEVVQSAVRGTKTMAREVGPAIRRASRATGAFAAANAVPLSLLGFGAGWMLMKGHRRGGPSREQTSVTSVQAVLAGPSESIEVAEASESIAGEIQHTRGKTREYLHAKGERGREVAHAASERAQRIAHATSERAVHLKDQTVHQMADARDAVSRQASKLNKEAHEQWAHAKEVTADFAQHNPLVLIALSLGAGMGTSYLFPSTRSENRLMGGPRDRVVGEARETVSRIGGIAHKAAIDVRQPLQH